MRKNHPLSEGSSGRTGKTDADHQATADDRFLLARLYSADGDWGKAQTEYRELMRDPEKTATPQEINRQVVRIVQYASELIAQIQAGANPQDEAEAQALIDRLRKIQPDAFNVLALQARLDKARDKIDDAVAQIKTIADRPGITLGPGAGDSRSGREPGTGRFSDGLVQAECRQVVATSGPIGLRRLPGASRTHQGRARRLRTALEVDAESRAPCPR